VKLRKAHGFLVSCPNCGKQVKANWSPKTSDGLALLTYRHQTPAKAPCEQTEVAPPPSR
jgi:hypothetical protein